MAAMSGALGEMTPEQHWHCDGGTRPPIMRSSSSSDDNPHAPAVASATIRTGAVFLSCVSVHC